MDIACIMVVGAGQMGSGIAQVAAQAGYRVLLQDLSAELVQRGKGSVARLLGRAVEKGRMSPEERDATLGRIEGVTALSAASGAQVVIEAVVEDAGVKKTLLGEMDRLCSPGTILATNTSSISITELAAATTRPDRFIGMHFMNPVPLMQLVEIIRGQATSDQTHAAIFALAQALGKTPVTVRDYPGFVANRLLMPMINEAAFCLMEGVASAEDIDTVMKLGMNHPMGPLALADLIGLDTCLAIMEVLHTGFGDSKYRPCPLLRRLVKAGQLGRKTGRGFYQY
ncbi:MAG TPA: 3-hydroxybutyryl-CoA dehydrogenase [Clostridiales bacterium UBA8153]|nr:3-hydroxybutyryl-CoA dehydrogenase [Clostridiales bacterium UBA8153]